MAEIRHSNHLLHSISNEENGHVVANHVQVSLSRVEFDGKPSWVTKSLWAASLMNYGGKPKDAWSSHSRASKKISARQVRDVVCHLCHGFGLVLCLSLIEYVWTAGTSELLSLASSRKHCLTSKKPLAEAPRACTTRSGIRSLSN